MDTTPRVMTSEAEANAYMLGVKDERFRQYEIRRQTLATLFDKIDAQDRDLHRLNSLVDELRGRLENEIAAATTPLVGLDSSRADLIEIGILAEMICDTVRGRLETGFLSERA